MTNPIKIIVAEDHQIVLDGLLSILTEIEEIEIVATAKNGNEVLDALSQKEVDIALLDLNMPELDGIETSKKIQINYPKTKILILTMHNNVHYLKTLYEIGVSGYLLKDVPKTELVQALKVIHSGGTYFDQQIMSKALSELSNRTIKLTAREKEILELLNLGLSTKELSDKLFISPHTVETHRKHLLEKFNVGSSTKLLSNARDLGYI